MVECIGVENCPWALGIALICHCGLGKVNFMYDVPNGLEIVDFIHTVPMVLK